MYGPNDDKSKFTTSIFGSLKKNMPKIELTPGEQKRDFIYIDDVVGAYILLLNKRNIGLQFSEYDIGSGKAVSIREFVELAKKISKSDTILIFGAKPYSHHEIMTSVANISPLTKLGWKPSIELPYGIKECFETG